MRPHLQTQLRVAITPELSGGGPRALNATEALSRRPLQRLVELSRCAAGPETVGVNLDVYGMHAAGKGG